MNRARGRPPSEVLRSQRDVVRGVQALANTCAVMHRITKETGAPKLRRHTAGLEGLARIVVGQQLSVASAAAIWERLAQAVRPFDAEQLAALADDDLKACGLSRPKIATLRGLSNAVIEGELDFDALKRKSTDEVCQDLTKLKGIGPWSADIYVMFCMGHRDGFAGGDLALQEAARHAFGLDARPDAMALAELAERWRPWRGVGALVLWDYYKHVKQSKLGAPV